MPIAQTTVTKLTIASRLAHEYGLPVSLVRRVLSSFLDTVSEELASGNRLEFRGFGVFDVVFRHSRPALNPKTGERLQTVPRHVPRFSPGSVLRGKIIAAFDGAPEAGDTALESDVPE